jgi:hypothetical protein
MPRKKAGEALTAASLPARITCPACKSEISGDGATLHSLSKYLDELIETAGDVEKLEKAIGELEGKLSVARAEVAKVKQETQSKTEAKKDETVGPKVGDGKPKSSWW